MVIGNYQYLNLYDGKDLAILSPRDGLRLHEKALTDSIESQADISHPLIKRAVAYYQAASYGFTNHLLDWETPKP